MQQKVATYNDMLCESCCKEGVSFIDMTAESDTDHSELFRPNHFHLSRKGVEKLDKVLAMLLNWLSSNECRELHLINGTSKDLRQYSLHDRPGKSIALYCSAGHWSVVSFGKTIRSEQYTCRKLNTKSVHKECWSLVPQSNSGKKHKGVPKLKPKEINERYPLSEFAMIETSTEDVVAIVHSSKCCFPYNMDDDLTTDTTRELKEEIFHKNQQDPSLNGPKKRADRKKHQATASSETATCITDASSSSAGIVSYRHQQQPEQQHTTEESVFTSVCQDFTVCFILYVVVLYILYLIVGSE